MSKPDFKQMSRKALKQYVLNHRDDDEAIRELFVNRWPPSATKVPADMPLEQQETLFKKLIERQQRGESKQDSDSD